MIAGLRSRYAAGTDRAGRPVVDDGVMIDVSLMRQIQVSADSQPAAPLPPTSSPPPNPTDWQRRRESYVRWAWWAWLWGRLWAAQREGGAASGQCRQGADRTCRS